VGGARISAAKAGLSTGPVIVLLATALAAVSLLVAPGRGLVWRALRRFRNRRELAEQAVLLSIYKLAVVHNDPDYPAELGMIDAIFEVNTAPLLTRLSRNGLVDPTAHMAEEGKHWKLTKSGRVAAEKALAELGSPSGQHGAVAKEAG
ncbi:MAG: hypothetical protein KC561_11950, partial [Myxococcales bacterium]|nr:hypothetical protein [Myxococcales bacterium]